MVLTPLILAAALAAPALESPTVSRTAADTMPDFNADNWWNSIPLTMEQLRGRTVFVEVFRTW